MKHLPGGPHLVQVAAAGDQLVTRRGVECLQFTRRSDDRGAAELLDAFFGTDVGRPTCLIRHRSVRRGATLSGTEFTSRQRTFQNAALPSRRLGGAALSRARNPAYGKPHGVSWSVGGKKTLCERKTLCGRAYTKSAPPPWDRLRAQVATCRPIVDGGRTKSRHHATALNSSTSHARPRPYSPQTPPITRSAWARTDPTTALRSPNQAARRALRIGRRGRVT